MVRVKICGIRSLDEALTAVNAGADALGFVFAHKSKRYIDPASVWEITKKLPPFVARVGVFVDFSPAEVERITRVSGLTVIQLHGDENPADYSHLGLPLIKAIKVDLAEKKSAFKNNDRMNEDFGDVEEDLITELQGWQGQVQGILVDSAVMGQFGGTGQPLPWSNPEIQSLFMNIKASGISLILAGGLNPENVKDAIETVRPEIVDVSSGVETAGKKDARLVNKFITECKKAAYPAAATP